MGETWGLKGDTRKGIRNRTEVKHLRVKRAAWRHIKWQAVKGGCK